MTDLSRDADSVRLVMYHKQSTSARTCYLKLGCGSVCAFQFLPDEAEMIFDVCDQDSDVLPHPGAVIAAAEHWLGLDSGALDF